MFTEGGQPDLRSRAARGGKGGGSSASSPQPTSITLTDPVNGKSFVQSTTGNAEWDYLLGYDQQTSAQDQLNAEITARQATEAQTSATTAATAAAKSASDESTFQTNKTNAYNTAMQQAINAFKGQGVDPNQYMDQYINPALQYQQNTIQDLDPAPQSAFPTNLGQTIVNTATADKRTQALNQLNNIFTPTYATDQLPTSIMKPYIDQTLSTQFDPLSQQLVNAQKRNMLTGQGYQAAVDAMNAKRTGAQATVTNLGQSILSSDQSSLNDYISGARTDANSLNLGSKFDPTSYQGVAQDKVNTDVNTFGGALSNAVGNTQFSDLTSLINAGGAVQGAQNPNAMGGAGTSGAGLTPASAGGGDSSGGVDPSQLDPTKQARGLGSQGAF